MRYVIRNLLHRFAFHWVRFMFTNIRVLKLQSMSWKSCLNEIPTGLGGRLPFFREAQMFSRTTHYNIHMKSCLSHCIPLCQNAMNCKYANCLKKLTAQQQVFNNCHDSEIRFLRNSAYKFSNHLARLTCHIIQDGLWIRKTTFITQRLSDVPSIRIDIISFSYQAKA